MAAPVSFPLGVIGGVIDQVWSDLSVGITSLVPDPYIVSINNHVYLADLEFKPWKRQAMRATTTTTTRTQADTSNEPGEQSLSTESLWRRTQDSWHLGAGQVYLDRKNSEEYSFRDSMGVDPWTQWELTLLNKTALVGTTPGASNVQFAVCGEYLMAIVNQEILYTLDGYSWSAASGLPSSVHASSICSDGSSVYATYGAQGIYTLAAGSSVATQYVTDPVDPDAVIRFVLGRLMLGSTTHIYNIVAGGTLPTPLGTSTYGNLKWCDFTAGNGCIFAAGNAGNFGVVYSIQMTSDGTSLALPIICGQLPNGENVGAIYGYAGSGLVLGTSLGWRWSEQALANDVAGTVALTIGPLFPLNNTVRCWAAWDRFLWGNLDNIDYPAGVVPAQSAVSGLFRIDPSQFVADLAPAYANDLMIPQGDTANEVTSVIFFAGQVLFAVADIGIYIEKLDTPVDYGWVDSGLITYGLSDNKMPVYVDLALTPMTGNVDSYVSLDGGSWNHLGQTNSKQISPLYEFKMPQQLCQTIELRERLVPNAGVAPILNRHTLRAVPAPPVPTDWNVVIQLREAVRIKDIEVPQVPSDEYKYLDFLRANKTICSVQVGNIGPLSMTIESIDWIPEQWGSLSGELNGVAVLTCRTVV